MVIEKKHNYIGTFFFYKPKLVYGIYSLFPGPGSITDRFDPFKVDTIPWYVTDRPEYVPKAIYYAPGFESRGERCLKSQKTKLNGLNNTWRYSGGSRARLRLWIPYLDKFGMSNTRCFPELR